MGYYVSIIKTEAGKKLSITLEEVVTLLKKTPELEMNEDSFGNLLITSKLFGEDGPLLIYSDGEIWSKTPDKVGIKLMIDIANKLKARVRGEALETYITPNETHIHPDDKVDYDAKRSIKSNLKWKSRVRKVAARIMVVCFFIFIGILAKLIFKF